MSDRKQIRFRARRWPTVLPVLSRSPTLDAPRLPLYIGGGIAAVGLLTEVMVVDGPVLCPFRRCTGGYCPACGGTRAARALLAGDLGEAWRQHPWTVLLALQFALLACAAAVSTAPFVRSRLGWLVSANLVIGLGIWALRLSQGSIPVPFS